MIHSQRGEVSRETFQVVYGRWLVRPHLDAVRVADGPRCSPHIDHHPLVVANEAASPLRLQAKGLILLREERQEMEEMHFKKSFVVTYLGLAKGALIRPARRGTSHSAVVVLPHRFQAGQRSTNGVSPDSTSSATAPPRLEPTIASG